MIFGNLNKQETVGFVEIDWAGCPVKIEVQWIAPERSSAPLIVFLHEGLGSVAMWKDFPKRLCDRLGWRGLVYSRPGYGHSTPRAAGEIWGLDFMHRQAYEVLPALLKALDVDGARQALWLLGHSDGASIALLYAARLVAQVTGLIMLAPHIFVEDKTVISIEQARLAYLNTDLRARLAKYHDEPDSAFWGWNRIWLDPDFRTWSIESEIKSIRCPLLAVQGRDDEYGSMKQIEGVAAALPQTELLKLSACGHSPQRDQPVRLIDAACAFIASRKQQVRSP